MDGQYYGYENIPVKENKYGRAERVFAFAAFAVGYLLLKSFTGGSDGGAGLGACVSTVLLIAAVAAYFGVKGVKQRAGNFAYLAFTAAFSLVYVLSDNVFIKFLVSVFILLAVTFYMYFTAGSGRGGFINDMFVFDMIKSLFIMPFSSFTAVFPAAFRREKDVKKGGFRFWHVLVGLALTIIPTAAAAVLLAHADTGFSKLLRDAGEFLSRGIGEEIMRLIFCVPVAMYFFGGLYSNAAGKLRNVLTDEHRERFLKAVSFVPSAAAYAAVTPLFILYIVFLSVQAKYYFGGFSSELPDGMTLAEYARTGFFELCAVAVINAAVIIALVVFTKKKSDGKPSAALKIFSVILCLFTLLLIAVAISKMVLYIKGYGLTELRVYTSWFMILLAFAFIFIIIKQLWSGFNFFAALAAAFAVLFGALCFCDVDARIAEYNVNRYISGADADIDVNKLANLSDSAIPYIIKLTVPYENKSEEKNDSTVAKAKEIIDSRKESESADAGVIYFNIPRSRANSLVKK